MMHLLLNPNLIGAHLGGWRHRDAYSNPVMNLAQAIETAQLAERGKLDGLFLADGNGVRDMARRALFEANFPSARPGVFDPVMLMAVLAGHTSRIGLVSTATTTFDEPWFVARRFASLDHISHGRAGWNAVTASNADDALNFNHTAPVGREERYARAEEFIEVVKGLWDSWADDAFVQDKAAGRFLDPGRVRALGHQGRFFKVAGPLNVPRTPQGRPVVFTAGQSTAGKELAARHADAMFGAGDGKATCQAEYADIKARMAQHGRGPDTLRFLPGVTVFAGRSASEADELYHELNELIPPALGLDYLSKIVTQDLSGLPLDGPMPPLQDQVVGSSAVRGFVLKVIREGNLTVRQAYQRVVSDFGTPVVKGSAADVADVLEDWYRGRACDGFVLTFPIVPVGLQNFVGLVVPELQRRGLFRTEYAGTTLRDHLGLARPPHPHFPSPAR